MLVTQNKPNYEPTTIILDGNHALCRCLYQPSYRELSNSQGMPTGAVYGFCSVLNGLTKKLGASSLIVAFDGGHSKRRVDIYEDYKKREPDEEVKEDTGMTHGQYFKHQFSWVKTLLDKLGIINISMEGREGDDLIFQLVHLIRGNKIIVSEDKDFCSLITDKISLYRPIRGEMITIGNFEQSTGCKTPKHFLFQKVLLGDGSDNIPQVCKGVGQSTIDIILKDISEDSLSPSKIIEVAQASSNSRARKLALAGTKPIERNLDLIDIAREEFSTLELMEICDKIREKRVADNIMAMKLMNVLEFSAATQGYINELSAQVTSYPTGDLVDTTYLRDRASGTSTALLG